jgi:hypothetical protein
MRVSRIGSILIFCTPIFSVVAVTQILPLTVHWYLNYLPSFQPIQPGIAWNLSTIALLAIGIGLLVYGFLKHEQQTHEEEKVIFVLAIALVLYGLFTNFLAFAYQIDAVPRLTSPEMAEYNLFIWTWLLKGSLWIVTGLALFARALIKFAIYRGRVLRERSLD